MANDKDIGDLLMGSGIFTILLIILALIMGAVTVGWGDWALGFFSLSGAGLYGKIVGLFVGVFLTKWLMPYIHK